MASAGNDTQIIFRFSSLLDGISVPNVKGSVMFPGFQDMYASVCHDAVNVEYKGLNLRKLREYVGHID
jgi:hypothetical protein